jgi:heat shock 70kDa protein 4
VIQDWLYGDGEDTSKAVYVAKFDEIRFVAGPIVQRYLDKQQQEQEKVMRKREAEEQARQAEIQSKRKADEEAKSKNAPKKQEEPEIQDEEMTDAKDENDMD